MSWEILEAREVFREVFTNRSRNWIALAFHLVTLAGHLTFF